MRGNFFKCGNRVVIEGIEIGSFDSMETKEDRNSLANSATILIPIYTIGLESGLSPSERVRSVLSDAEIIVGAKIEVYTFYYNNELLGNEFEEVLQFSGYIKQIISGFPTTLVCEDASFILRFGKIGKDWKTRTSIQNMIEYLCPISNDAFRNFRQQQGFKEPNNFTELTFDYSNSASVEFALQIYNVSPYDALQHLLKMFTLYGNVSADGGVYFGIGVIDKFKTTHELATNTNVIGRDIVPTNGLFENYYVEVNGVLANGSRYTYGLGDTNGTKQRKFCPLDTEEGIKQVAENVMQRLKGNRNKGTIQLVHYPDVRMFDFCTYTDTLFPELSGNYYVIGRSFTANENGYIQNLTVTNELFML